MRLLLGFLAFAAGLFSFGGEEFYCIQASSSKQLQFIKKEADKLSELPDVRVEKIGEFYTLRVGFFTKKEEARKILPKVKKLFSDAFVRGCYRIPERVVYTPTPRGNREKSVSELLLKAFLGAGRLGEARKLLEVLTKKYPEDAELWENYGKVLVWLGESEKALEAFLRAYSLRPSEKLASRILELALALRRYDVARNFLDKAGAPYEVRLQVYEQLGDIEALKALLKKKKDRRSLLILIRLLFLTGETEEAFRYAQEYERLYGVDAEFLFLKYEMLFAQRRFAEALKLLKENYERFKENKEFLEKLSDLAWSLGDYETSVRASLGLIKFSGGRLLDYDRASLALFSENPSEALRIAQEGWKKLRSLLLLERALLYAYNLGLYGKVLSLFSEAGEFKERLLSDPGILYVLADSLSKLNRKEEALSLVRKGLELNPSPDFIVLYASLAWEMGKRKALEELLRDFGSLEKDENYRLSFAFLYTLLGKGKKAYRLYSLSPKKDPLLGAEILSLLGKREEAHRLRRRRYEELKKIIREDPTGKRELLIEYLSLAQFFMPEPAYEKLLLRLRNYIPPGQWEELYVSFLINAERRDKLRHLVRVKRLTLRPWAEYSLALEDREKLLRLLERRGESLPVKDRLSALVAVGYYEMALELAYEILEENDYESNVAFVFGEIFEEWRGLWEAGLFLLSREGFGELRGVFNLRTPLRRRHYLRAELEKSTEFRKDADTVAHAPEALSLYLGLAFKSENWYYELLGGFYRRLEERLSFKGLLAGRLGGSLFLSFEGGYNTESTETLYASLGLLKRFLRVSSSYSFTPKDYLFLSLEGASFFGPSGRYVGKGTNFYGEFVKKLRLSYPDYSLRLFFQRGLYEEKEDKGKLSIVSPYRDFLVLPEDFTSFGIGLFFGDSYRKSLRYRGRPFGGLSWGYSTGIGGVFFGLYGGLSFPLNGGDRLSVVGSFYRNSGGVKEDVITLEVFYRRWY